MNHSTSVRDIRGGWDSINCLCGALIYNLFFLILYNIIIPNWEIISPLKLHTGERTHTHMQCRGDETQGAATHATHELQLGLHRNGRWKCLSELLTSERSRCTAPKIILILKNGGKNKFICLWSIYITTYCQMGQNLGFVTTVALNCWLSQISQDIWSPWYWAGTARCSVNRCQTHL